MIALLIRFLPGWVFGLPFRIGATLAIVSISVGSCMLRDGRLRHEGAVEKEKEIVTASQDHGKKAHAKSEKAHSAARQPGAADRLLADPKVCRDCN